MANQSADYFKDILAEKGVRPSYQRIRVLEFLRRKDSHPTVEEIYLALSPGIPTLSKATIYNTLHTLVKAGLARSVSLDETETRYDATIVDHGHFKCEHCGEITNFAVDYSRLDFSGLENFQIRERDFYFKGYCPKCQVQTNQRKG